MDRREDYLVDQAKRTTERVEKLYAAWKAGLGEAVAREIGTIDIESEIVLEVPMGGMSTMPPPSVDAAVMRAIAKRVVPKGWNWQVIESITGKPAFVIGTWEDPFEEKGQCDCHSCAPHREWQ